MRILGLVLIVVCSGVLSAVKWCSNIDNCRCATDKGVINLWSFQSQGNRPRFNVSGKSEASNGTLSYIWSPCVPWTFRSNLHQLGAPIKNCTNVAACRIEDLPVVGPISRDIGQHDLMNCTLMRTNTSPPSCALQYSVDYQSEHRTRTTIVLQCDAKEKATLEPFSVDFDHSFFTTTFHSVCACPGQCNSHGLVSQAMSTGFVLPVVDYPKHKHNHYHHHHYVGFLCSFVCCGFLYLIGGIIFNAIAKGARGQQMIPNLSFWLDLPYLIKDGVVFFCSCFTSKKVGYTPL